MRDWPSPPTPRYMCLMQGGLHAGTWFCGEGLTTHSHTFPRPWGSSPRSFSTHSRHLHSPPLTPLLRFGQTSDGQNSSSIACPPANLLTMKHLLQKSAIGHSSPRTHHMHPSPSLNDPLGSDLPPHIKTARSPPSHSLSRTRMGAVPRP
jgi:hypothetical protein